MRSPTNAPRATQVMIGDLTVTLQRKPIKNIRIAVYPPDGRVRVAAPRHVPDDAVRAVVTGRLDWIRRQQAKFQAQPRLAPPAYVSGETHYFLGRAYTLHVVEHAAPPSVTLHDSSLTLAVRPGSDTEAREQALLAWHRRQLKLLVPPLIAKWEPILGVQVAEWGIKRMTTRWGTCNPRARRIWLNLELVKAPPACLEYVVVHELVHLLERTHNAVFQAHMTRALPAWRTLRAQLNQAPLGHATWDC